MIKFDKKAVMGNSRNSTLQRMNDVSDVIRTLHKEIGSTTEFWELNLLEHLYNPMHVYPLPCITNRGLGGPAATIPFDYVGDTNPGVSNITSVAQVYPGGPLVGYGIPASTTSYNPGSGFFALDALTIDAAQHAKYDERHGLSRGNFSIAESGVFIVYFDPFDYGDPVRVICLSSTEQAWTDVGNTANILAGGQNRFSAQWDRDPYRGYTGDPQPVGYLELVTDRSTLVYVGGAMLHVAVQAKTAYSDVAMKARNSVDYDRRFYDAPDLNGEYGDPTQPTEAREGLAIYSGSTWRQRTFLPADCTDKALRSRLSYIISQGLPMLEIHVVNANTGGAPVNFNFEAKAWLGMTYHTLPDNATTAFHTIPAEIPCWFTTLRTRGAVTKNRTKLSEEVITHVQRGVASSIVPRVIQKVNEKVRPHLADTVFGDALKFIGVDPSNPLPSLGKLLAPLATKVLSAIL